MSKNFKVDNLDINIFRDRKTMGKQAATDVANRIKILLNNQKQVRMIFAAAPSQNEMLESLALQEGIDWTKVTAFQMDEYLGLEENAHQLFGNYLKAKIFGKVDFENIFYLNSRPISPAEECIRYADLLKQAPIDIICMGIGENGHIAFNDPKVADFEDKELVKIVDLDNISRQQQVNDGCFSSIDMVPKQAITLTIPMLMSGRFLFVVVPGSTKSNAIQKLVNNKISTDCPASILRNHCNSKLYLDMDSASKIIGQ